LGYKQTYNVRFRSHAIRLIREIEVLYRRLIWKKENSELYFNLYRAQKVWFTLMIGDDRQ